MNGVEKNAEGGRKIGIQTQIISPPTDDYLPRGIRRAVMDESDWYRSTAISAIKRIVRDQLDSVDEPIEPRLPALPDQRPDGKCVKRIGTRPEMVRSKPIGHAKTNGAEKAKSRSRSAVVIITIVHGSSSLAIIKTKGALLDASCDGQRAVSLHDRL